MIKAFYSFTLFIFFSCSQEGVSVVSADQLKELQKEGVTVVDIRTDNEYTAGHIPGVPKNIDFFGDDFADRMNEFDKSEPIIIHCARGGRSGKAAKQLQELGFTQIYDYVGGFDDWKKRGEKIEQ